MIQSPPITLHCLPHHLTPVSQAVALLRALLSDDFGGDFAPPRPAPTNQTHGWNETLTYLTSFSIPAAVGWQDPTGGSAQAGPTRNRNIFALPHYRTFRSLKSMWLHLHIRLRILLSLMVLLGCEQRLGPSRLRSLRTKR